MEEPADITPWLHHLDEAMKEKVQQLQKTRWVEEQQEQQEEAAPHRCSNSSPPVSAATRRPSVR